MTLSRRSLLSSLGLLLPAAAAEAATPHKRTHKPRHVAKAAPHGKPTKPHKIARHRRPIAKHPAGKG